MNLNNLEFAGEKEEVLELLVSSINTSLAVANSQGKQAIIKKCDYYYHGDTKNNSKYRAFAEIEHI